MSFNGSGTFVINSSGQPVVANTVISSTVFNALTADLATGLSTCITKDGQTTPTANIPMGTFKFTNLGNGSAATDSATLGQVQASTTKLVTVTGSDTIAGTMNPALTAYASGQMFYFIAAGANTGAVTLNIDGLGARNVTRDGSTALAANDILSGEVALVVYDGTRFQLLNPANAGSMTVSNLTVTGTTTLSGLTASTALALDASKAVVSVTNTGTGNNVLATSPTLTTPNLGTPSAIVLTNASGTASININGTVGATTPNTGSFTTLTTSSTVTLNGGTANGVLYLNGSKVATSGSALTFDGTNLGIGTTPSAWRSGARALQLGANGYVSLFEQGNGAANLTFAAYESAANTFAYRTTGDAPTLYSQVGGVHTWSNAVAGTAGNTFSFTERMRLDVSGNLGIGTASPAAKLDVTGTFNGLQSRFGFTAGRGLEISTAAVGGTNEAASILNAKGSGSGAVVFQTDSAEQMRINSTGLGIGTANPTYKIDLSFGAGSGNMVRFGQSGVSNGYTITTNGSALTHEWANSGSVSMAFTSSGNLGIGTASPTALLDVNADTMRLRTARTPASATAAGNAGDICWDATYLYICTATNTWRRILHATW